MTARIKIFASRFGLTFLVLVAALFWVAGCAAPKPASDPLAGWKSSFSQSPKNFAKAITDDYRDYIQKLPPEERYYFDEYNVWFYEDGTGQHAVRIEIPLNGAYYEHVLIYDKDDKRLKVITYSGGRYAS